MADTSAVEIVLGAVLGTLFSIVTTALIDFLRRPKLTLDIIEPRDIPVSFTNSNNPAQPRSETARFLTLHVKNKPLPKILRWLNRNTAIQCQGKISFHHFDGQNIFDRVMQARWAGTPEPVFPWFVYAGNKTVIVDPARFRMEAAMNIQPGAHEGLDIVIRYADEEDCYGWNNESYNSDTQGKNPRWHLNAHRYLVKVTVEASGHSVSKIYRLINDVKIQDFRLTLAQRGDRVKD